MSGLPLVVRPRPGARRRVLGLDPGTHCGFAVADVDGEIAVRASGTWDLGSDDYVRRWARLDAHLRETIGAHRPDLVAFERVHAPHKSTAAARTYWGAVAILGLVAAASGLHIAEVTVGRVKQRATGKGNADKIDVAVAAMSVLGRSSVPPFDEADALFVALAAADDFLPEPT